jgi:hypothetical protein
MATLINIPYHEASNSASLANIGSDPNHDLTLAGSTGDYTQVAGVGTGVPLAQHYHVVYRRYQSCDWLPRRYARKCRSTRHCRWPLGRYSQKQFPNPGYVN